MIDWQAYLDGSLNAADREQADELLRTDPQARRELDGLKAFCSEVRRAGLLEPVPERRLEELLPSRRQPKFSLFRVGVVLAPVAAAAAVAYFVFVYDPMALARTPTVAVLETSDPAEAATWATQRAGFRTPVLDPGREAVLGMTRFGKGWACYDYFLDGKSYFLYMSPDGSPLRKGRPDGRFLVGRGVGWEDGPLAFYLKGGDDEQRMRLARYLSGQTARFTSNLLTLTSRRSLQPLVQPRRKPRPLV